MDEQEVIDALVAIGFQRADLESFTNVFADLRRGDLLVSLLDRKRVFIKRCLPDGKQIGRAYMLPLTDIQQIIDTVALFERGEN